MLQHVARALPILVRAGLARRSLVSCIDLRVGLTQTDLNRHMNQASYAEVGERGRTDWILRSGLARQLLQVRVKPVVAEQRIVYRRELKPGQRFKLDTRATGIDGRLIDVDGHLIVGDRVHAVVYAKLISIGPDGVLDADAAHALLSPFVTDALEVEDWRVVDGARQAERSRE